MIEALRSAITGNYQIIGDINTADHIVALSFGAAHIGPGAVNVDLGNFIADQLPAKMPVIAQQEVADALGEHSPPPRIAHRIEGKPSTGTGGELDSYAVLREARDEAGRQRIGKCPIVVGQAHHIGRVVCQARLLDIADLVIPAGLPKTFDPSSAQPWTRNRGLWVAHEILGYPVLKRRGKI